LKEVTVLLLVREKRKERGLSQKQLAQLSGVKQSTISMIETDDQRNPGIYTVEALARAMGLGLMDVYQPDTIPAA
jgi:transcriptional regulator with XRE-family HTH domain